ncbi:MAG: hypothetical protein WCS94_20175 [Verrucomicrobiota bacterium]
MKNQEVSSQKSGVRIHLTPTLSPIGGEGGPSGRAPSEAGQVRRLEWWEALTPGEKKLICNLMRMLRGAKHSQIQEVARAAAKWERGIGCFIKVRLVGENRKAESRKQKWIGLTQRRQGAVCIKVESFRRDAETDPRDAGATASPSTSRSLPLGKS